MDLTLSPEQQIEYGEQQKLRDRQIIALRRQLAPLVEKLFESHYLQTYAALYFEVVARKCYLHGGKGTVELTELPPDDEGIPGIRLHIVNENMSIRDVYGTIERDRGRQSNNSLARALSFMDEVDIQPLDAGGVTVTVTKRAKLRGAEDVDF